MPTEQSDVGVAREGSTARARSELLVGGAQTGSTSAEAASGAAAGGPPPPRTVTPRPRRPVVAGLAALALGLAAYAAFGDGGPAPTSDQAGVEAEDGRQSGDSFPSAGGRPSGDGQQSVADGADRVQEVVGDPFEGRSLYVDPDNPASRQADAWRASRPSDAAAMDRIGENPAARWFGRSSGQVGRDVDRYVSAAEDAGALPVLVAYNIPQRDCNHFSSGGAASADDYRAWIGDFAAGIGDRPAVVILEPDALAHLSCLSESDRTTRVQLLGEAVARLEERPGVSVYIDAGNPGWIGAEDMADLLVAAGVDRARGFALNVSNYHSTELSVGYAQELSDRLGGKSAVIDTSRSGAGSNGEWCNAMGRALGPPPSHDAADPAVDAYLWVKTPGESDGECNGGPSAGEWWPEYALDLAARAAY